MTVATNPSAENYEQIRQRNIAANRSLLLSLQLSGPGLTPKLIPKATEKKSTNATEYSGEAGQKIRKSRRKSVLPGVVLQETQVDGEGRRRSGRILGLTSNEKKHRKEESSEEEEEYEARDSDCSDDSDGQENQVVGHGKKRKSAWHPPREPKRARGSEPPKRKAKSLKGSRPNPKIFGHQIGSEVGDWWDSRMMCSQAGVHAPPVCGIYGTEELGCYSVALSGGYEDDVDLGYAFTFTGAGGRALRGTPNNPKNLRTAPQSSDQEFTSVNAALRLSCETKNPVRVIRGFKNHSPFAPDEGYRYDGLYKVEKCWREPGQSGFQVCKFAFVRLPNQPRIPVKEGREAEAEQMYQDMGFKLEDLPPLPPKRQPWTQSLAKQRQQAKNEAQKKTEDEQLKEDKQEQSADLSEQQHEEPTKADQKAHDISLSDAKLDSVDICKEEEKEQSKADEQTNDAEMNGDKSGLAEVSKEQEKVESKADEESHNADTNDDKFNSIDVSKQQEKEQSEANEEAPTCNSKENGESNEGEKEINEEAHHGDSHDDVFDSVNHSKPSAMNKEPSGPDQRTIDECASNQVQVSKQPQEEKSQAATEADVKVCAEDSVDTGKQQPNDVHEQTVTDDSKEGQDDQAAAGDLVPVQGDHAHEK